MDTTLKKADSSSIVECIFAPIPLARFRSEFWPLNIAESHESAERFGTLMIANELTTAEGLLNTHEGIVNVLLDKGPQLQLAATDGLRYFHSGHTVCIHHVWRTVPVIAEIMLRIAKALELKPGDVQCNAYASPHGSGIPLHFDDHEVIILHLRGEKEWTLWENSSARFPTVSHVAGRAPREELSSYAPPGFDTPPQNAGRQVLMKSGSALFVPRGTWHSTTSRLGSLSLTFSLLAPTVCDLVLRQLRAKLIQHETFRKPLGSDAEQSLAVKTGTFLADQISTYLKEE